MQIKSGQKEALIQFGVQTDKATFHFAQDFANTFCRLWIKPVLSSAGEGPGVLEQSGHMTRQLAGSCLQVISS